MESAEIQKHNGGAVQTVRQGFGEVESRQQFETAATAVAARQQALVQARFIVALQRPRDVDEFRVRLLKECKRPGFAELAEYARPVGKEFNEETGKWEKKIARGPSVHLIRTALALYKNIDADSVTVFENADSRVTHAYVLDLETNVGWGRTLVIPKITEKRGFEGRGGKVEPPKGRDVIGERVNSDGQPVFICRATEDETRNKESSLVAKAQRENGRAVLPRDIIDEAIRVSKATIAAADKQDPDAAKRRVIDGFAELNVSPSDLAEYLGHSVDKISPSELAELRKVFVSLREGEVSWVEVMQEENPVGSAEAAQNVAAEKLSRMRGGGQSSAGVAAQAVAEEIAEKHPEAAEHLRQAAEALEPKPLTEAEMKAGEKAALEAEEKASQGRIQFPRGKR